MKRRRALGQVLALGALASGAMPRAARAQAEPKGQVAAEPPPAWRPAPGMRADISLNLLADVDPCPRRNCVYSGVGGQKAVIAAWSGAAFATAYGKLGAWVISGGGHGDYYGNEVYAFELDSRRWVRLNDPYDGGPKSAVDYEEGEYAPGIPLSSHAYQHPQYLPPELGGGSRGSLLMVVKYAAGRAARGSGRSHACDLATGRWSRYSENRASQRLHATSSTAFDPARRGYWRVPYGGQVIEFLDAADRRWRNVAVAERSPRQFGVDHVCAIDPLRDLLVVLDWAADGGSAWALDLASRRRWHRIDTGDGLLPGATRGMSIEWCPPLRGFVCYEAGGATFVRKLHPAAADAPAGAWRWSVEELGGPPPAARAGGPRASYSRFRWAPRAGCFIWADGNRLPVQAWRLRDT